MWEKIHLNSNLYGKAAARLFPVELSRLQVDWKYLF